jgi:hypothetical protein
MKFVNVVHWHCMALLVLWAFYSIVPQIQSNSTEFIPIFPTLSQVLDYSHIWMKENTVQHWNYPNSIKCAFTVK